MTIDPTVRGVCQNFSIDLRFHRLIQAVVDAEGGLDAIVRAVQCSIPAVQTREEALKIVCKSAVHAMTDFVHTSGLDKGFVGFWAGRWAPVGAANDPHGLNAAWPKNVWILWSGETGSTRSTQATGHD